MIDRGQIDHGGTDSFRDGGPARLAEPAALAEDANLAPEISALGSVRIDHRRLAVTRSRPADGCYRFPSAAYAASAA